MFPQQYALPAVERAQVIASPAPMAMNCWLPLTAVGLRRLVFVPSPSWPLPLMPQQKAAPLARPQLWLLPLASTENM
jgi:hypothetical protein